jgi:hypothetical protein
MSVNRNISLHCIHVLRPLLQAPPGEQVELELQEPFARLLLHGIAQFHGLRCVTRADAAGVKRCMLSRHAGVELDAYVHVEQQQRQQPPLLPTAAGSPGRPALTLQQSQPLPLQAAAMSTPGTTAVGAISPSQPQQQQQQQDVTCADVLLALHELGAESFGAGQLQAYLRRHIHGSICEVASDDYVLV